MESRIESSADFVDYMIPLSSIAGGPPQKKMGEGIINDSQLDTPMGLNINNS
jgi:hypothetical protein